MLICQNHLELFYLVHCLCVVHHEVFMAAFGSSFDHLLFIGNVDFSFDVFKFGEVSLCDSFRVSRKLMTLDR